MVPLRGGERSRMSKEKYTPIAILDAFKHNEDMKPLWYKSYSLGRLRDSKGKEFLAIGWGWGDMLHPTSRSILQDEKGDLIRDKDGEGFLEFDCSYVILYLKEAKAKSDWEWLKANPHGAYDLLSKRKRTPTVARIL